MALESATPTLVDAALRGVPTILPVLDFSTIKNELFPVIATIFSKTNSLAIKVRGLQAFVILCGGSNDAADDDGLAGFSQDRKKTSSSSALDKYTMQEKIIPLVKGIKTKEPAVMMAALNVLRVVGQEADVEFVAMEILPILWSMSLGPLLNLKQFRSFMDLIKTLSGRAEEEQTKKLQELTGNSNGATALPNEDFMSFGAIAGTSFDANGTTTDDFELLVKGKISSSSATNPMDAGWDGMTSTSSTATVLSPGVRSAKSSTAPAFSWSTPSPTTSAPPPSVAKVQQPGFRTVTPDLAQFAALAPSTTQFSQPLQPSPSTQQQQPAAAGSSLGWGATPAATPNPWGSTSATPTPTATNTFGGGLSSPMASMALDQRPGMGQSRGSSFSLPPPPLGNAAGSGAGSSGFSLAPPPGVSQNQQATSLAGAFGRPAAGSTGLMGNTNSARGSGVGMNSTNNNSMGSMMGTGSMNSMANAGMNGMRNMGAMAGMAQQQAQRQQPQQPQQPSKSGLDKYESLL